MKLSDLMDRSLLPEPWGEADNIPWNEPAFSERMLAEHLSQDHDAASRRTEIVDEHVHWIHTHLLKEQPAKVLDLACGPGLYSSRLNRLGHTVTGIDFSPASIRYARQEAEKANLSCVYIESDIRKLEYGGPFDLVMLIYGEFNVFKPAEAGHILQKINRALKPGGTLLLEPQNFNAIQRANQQPPVWRTYRQGLFSDKPHVYLQENFWDGRTNTVTTRYWVVDVETAEVSRYGQTTQAYTDASLQALLGENGFGQVTFYPALAPQEDQPRQDVFGLSAVKLS
jgi:SAM-dependent methyltransferase